MWEGEHPLCRHPIQTCIVIHPNAHTSASLQSCGLFHPVGIRVSREYKTNVGWTNALTEFEIILNISTSVPTEPNNVIQVEPASNQEVARPRSHEAIASAAMAPSPPKGFVIEPGRGSRRQLLTLRR